MTLYDYVAAGKRYEQRVRELLAANPFWKADDRLAAERTAAAELRAWLADGRSLPLVEQRQLLILLAQMALVEGGWCQSGEAEELYADAADHLTSAAVKLEEAEDAEARHRPKQLDLYAHASAEAA